jgi:putative acetyltransferase
MIHIRLFKETDLNQIIRLFHQTVRSVNPQDYSPEQLHVWTPDTIDTQSWLDSLKKNITYVAEQDDIIVGFADLTHTGYLDRIYVHKDSQRHGVASALLKTLEQKAKELNLAMITTESSITALRFFEKHGYSCHAQTKNYKNIDFGNFMCTKQIN